MEIAILFEIPHIIISKSDNKIILSADDYELWDYLDDYLSEKYDIESEYVDHNNRKQLKSYFKLEHEKNIVDAIKNLDSNEVESIWKLNN